MLSKAGTIISLATHSPDSSSHVLENPISALSPSKFPSALLSGLSTPLRKWHPITGFSPRLLESEPRASMTDGPMYHSVGGGKPPGHLG